jgi:hypothetical protein
MNEGRDIWNLGDRLLDDLRGDPATTAILPNPFAEAVFIFDGGFGEDVMFTIDADKPSAAYLVAPDGFVEFALEDTSEENEIEFELGIDGPHFLSVLPVIDYEVAVEIATETDLIQMVDPDHGRTLAIGDTIMGNTDYPGDWDWFDMQLTEGDVVTIRVTSSSTDAGIAIDYFDNTEEEFVASDSDSAGGVLGLDAEVSFTAPGDRQLRDLCDRRKWLRAGRLHHHRQGRLIGWVNNRREHRSSSDGLQSRAPRPNFSPGQQTTPEELRP